MCSMNHTVGEGTPAVGKNICSWGLDESPAPVLLLCTLFPYLKKVNVFRRYRDGTNPRILHT